MEENETTVVPAENQEQDVEITLEEDTPTEETVEIDWKAEAIKQKAIAQRYAKKLQGGTPAPKQDLIDKKDDDIRLTVKELQLAEQKRQFGYANNLSPEETDAVFKLSANPTKEVLEDPFVKGGLAALRAKKRVSENIPSSSSRSGSFKLPSKEEATPESKQKAYEEFVKNRLGR